MVTAATAAARARCTDTTTDLLAASRDIAQRVGHDRADHQTTFGPAKVAMLTVDCHIALENFPEALSAAKQLPDDAALPRASRARHLADLAYAHTRLGHDDKALTTLLTMESTAPDWIKYQTLPREITQELLAREQRKSTPSAN